MAEVFPLRLKAYDPTGKSLGEIAAPLEVTWYDKMGDTSTLDVKLSRLAPTHNKVTPGGYIALELRKYQTNSDGSRIIFWTEPRNARMVIARQEYDRKDPSQSLTIDGIGMLSVLANAKVWDTSLSLDGKRVFRDRTAGDIMRTLLDEAKSRGRCPMIVPTFNATYDGGGRAWVNKLDRDYEPSTDLRTVLIDLYNAGELDYYFQGNSLYLLVPGQEADYTTGNVRHYVRDTQVPKSPESESWADIVNAAMLIGDEGYSAKKTNADAVSFYGGREIVLAAGGVTSKSTANVMIDQQLKANQDVVRDYTREYTYVDESFTPSMPGRDFAVGDWIYVDTILGKKQRMRVMDYSLKLGNDNQTTAFLTVGTVKDDAMSRIQKRQKGIEAGAKTLETGAPKPKIPASALQFDTAPGSPTAGMKLNANLGMQAYGSGGIPTIKVEPSTGAVSLGDDALKVAPTTGNAVVDWEKTTLPTKIESKVDDSNYTMAEVDAGGFLPRFYATASAGDEYGNISASPTSTNLSVYANAREALVAANVNTYTGGSSRGVVEIRTASSPDAVNDTLTLGGIAGGNGGFQYTWNKGSSPWGHGVFMKLNSTTTASYTLSYNSSTTEFRYVTSRGDHKLEQQEVGVEAIPAILGLTPKSWVDRTEREADPNYSARSLGYVVEEVDEVSLTHGGVLDPIILRDEDGAPASLVYDRLPDPYTLVILKDLQRQINELKAP